MTRKQKIIAAALAVMLLGGCSGRAEPPDPAAETAKTLHGRNAAASFSAGIAKEDGQADAEPAEPPLVDDLVGLQKGKAVR